MRSRKVLTGIYSIGVTGVAAAVATMVIYLNNQESMTGFSTWVNPKTPLTVWVTHTVSREPWGCWVGSCPVFKPKLTGATNRKRGCVFLMVIRPAFRMRQYRANDHPYHAPQYTERFADDITVAPLKSNKESNQRFYRLKCCRQLQKSLWQRDPSQKQQPSKWQLH